MTLERLRWRSVCTLVVLLLASAVVHSASADDLVFTPAPVVLKPEGQQLLDIAQAGQRMVAVGAAGLIVTSDDNGRSWEQVQAVPVSATLTAVSFPTPELGWAAGHAGVILHTRDAGASWEKQFDGYAAARAFLDFATSKRMELEAQMDALEAGDGDTNARVDLEELEYALEDAIFIEEEAQLAVENGPADPFLDLAFFDGQRGLAVGAYGMSFRTDDGGENWVVNQAGIENMDRFHLYGVYIDGQRVYLAGEAGLLFESEDEGAEFRRFFDVYEGSLFSVLPVSAGVVSFGLRGNVFLQRSANEDWESQETGSENSLYGGAALKDGGALLLGAGGTLLRLDADMSARVFRHPSRATFSAALEGADGEIWLVGMDGVARFSQAVAQ